MLNMLDLDFEIVPSDKEESSDKTNPEEYVLELSKIKAEDVAEKVESDAIILAVDTIAYMDCEKFEKPRNKEEAIQMLKRLSGKTNIAVSGMTIKDLYQNKEVHVIESTKVHFKELTDEDIDWYVENQVGLLGIAGYALGGLCSLFVDRIEGDYYNVLGLPLSRLHDAIKELGYDISDFQKTKQS